MRWIALLIAVAAAAAALGTATAATSGVVVAVTISGATSLDVSGCAPSSAPTSFGVVQPGTSVVTSVDCAVAFSSSNATAHLRGFQSDVGGSAMWRSPNGSLDGAFGTNGIVTEHVNGEEGGEDVAIAPDGGILVAGWSTATTENTTIVRFTSAGALDVAFNGSGYRTTNVGGNDRAQAIALQPDGAILVAGFTTGTDRDASVVRYTAAGTLDTTFSGDGIATLNVSGDDEITSIALQPDGGIVLGGTTAGGMDSLLLRYTTAGVLDTTFSGDGIRIVDASSAASDGINAVAIQGDGAIVAAGWATATTENTSLLRLLPNGTLDSTFDGNGIASVHVGGNDRAEGVALQPDGKIVTAGYETGATRNFAFVRVDAAGAPDPSFGGTGSVTVGVQNEDSAFDVAVLGDGTILAVGQAVFTFETSVLVKLMPDGSRDTTLDGNGIVTHDIGGSDGLRGLAVSGDGTAIAAGYQTATTRNFGALRLSTIPVADFATGVTDWTTGSSMFGACLRAIDGAFTSATWTPDADGDCADAGTDPWYGISTTAAGGSIAAATASGAATTARLRFGMRIPSTQAPGRYVAPIAFEVIAPVP